MFLQDSYGALTEDFYDYSEEEGFSYQAKWDLWGLLTQNLTGKYPLQAAIGNHEMEVTNYGLTVNTTGQSTYFPKFFARFWLS